MAIKTKANGATSMSSTERDLALAEALLKRGELDEAEQLMDKCERIVKAQQAAADAGDDDQDDEDALDDTDDDGDGEDDGQDDDDEDDVAKSFREDNITYPHDDLTDAMNEHRQVEHPQLTTHPTWHRFMERARTIAARDGCPLHVAMQRARGEMGADFISDLRQPISAVKKLGLPKTPPLYPESDLQDELASSSREKKRTHRRRVRHHNQQVKSHEDAVADQMSKGLSREIAEQRVMYAYGNTLPRSDIAKAAGDSLVTTFMAKVDACMINEEVDRTEAMRRIRKRHQGLFDAFQIV
jgi:hypothetical protein